MRKIIKFVKEAFYYTLALLMLVGIMFIPLTVVVASVHYWIWLFS